jgi:predicted restriction endonuclease
VASEQQAVGHKDNQDISQRILGDPAFRSIVMNHYLQRIFTQARSG